MKVSDKSCKMNENQYQEGLPDGLRYLMSSLINDHLFFKIDT